jgi:phosphohistidine phosphatase SixA
MTRIEAAGGVLWRQVEGQVEIALVHRPKYDDWSVPKGKLDPGEHGLLAALREVREETSWTARPGNPLGEEQYTVDGGDDKRVRYWSLEAVQGDFAPHPEIDQLCWSSAESALQRLSTGQGRTAVEAFMSAPLRTWPVVLVRHASAGDRAAWEGDDAQRPLDGEGRRQAEPLVPLLSAYSPGSLHAADNVRCLHTLAPLSAATGLPVDVEPLLNEAGYAGDAARATEWLAGLARRGPFVACSQRGPLPELVQRVATALGGAASTLATPPMGASLVVHLTADPDVRVVAIEACEAP